MTYPPLISATCTFNFKLQIYHKFNSFQTITYLFSPWKASLTIIIANFFTFENFPRSKQGKMWIPIYLQYLHYGIILFGFWCCIIHIFCHLFGKSCIDPKMRNMYRSKLEHFFKGVGVLGFDNLEYALNTCMYTLLMYLLSGP